jgi:hypothetical protein
MTTNPSHILIARNSRGHNPSASLSSPTETHAAASGIFRSSGSPPWKLEEVETADIVSQLSMEDEEPVEIDETFTKDSSFPGTVKIIVQSTTFWSVTNPLAANVERPSHSSKSFCRYLLSGLIKKCCSSPHPSSRLR